MDPFGQPPPLDVLQCAKRYGLSLVCNRHDEQGLSQESCGYYSSAVAKWLLAGVPFDTICTQKLHAGNFAANQRTVVAFAPIAKRPPPSSLLLAPLLPSPPMTRMFAPVWGGALPFHDSAKTKFAGSDNRASAQGKSQASARAAVLAVDLLCEAEEEDGQRRRAHRHHLREG
jgi:hypothetical protein